MRITDVAQPFTALEQGLSPEEYNYEHFRTRHLVSEVRAFIAHRGIQPGAMAPDFEFPCIEGGSLRLSALCGQPILLHFGSLT